MANTTILGFLQRVNAMPAEVVTSSNFQRINGFRHEICGLRLDLMRVLTGGVRFWQKHNVKDENIIASAEYIKRVDLALDRFDAGKVV